MTSPAPPTDSGAAPRAPLDTARLHDLAISDQGFVFDPVTGHTFTVNPTGLTALRLLKAGRAVGEVAQELRDAFEVDASEDVGRDLDEFLLRLREHGLVRGP
jgi:PqqD family protein of HPr-rel-A system